MHVYNGSADGRASKPSVDIYLKEPYVRHALGLLAAPRTLGACHAYRSTLTAIAAAVLTCAAAVAAVPAVAAPPASVQTVQVDRIVVLSESETANSGYVVFRVERATVAAKSPEASVQPRTVKSVGGGTWDYGSAGTLNGKACHSYYQHPSVPHSSSVSLGSKSDVGYAGPGSTSFAYVKGSYLSTCYAYWNKN